MIDVHITAVYTCAYGTGQVFAVYTHLFLCVVYLWGYAAAFASAYACEGLRLMAGIFPFGLHFCV